MKKLIVLILIGYSVLLNAQTPFNIRGELKQIYKVGGANDTTIQKFSSDSALWLSTKPIFKFNKRVHAPWFFSSGDTVATRPWVRSLIGNETDPVWTNAQPYYVNRVELGDTARAIRDDFPTGSTITASDGVYMDGDTVKLGRELLLNESLSDHFGINNDGIGGYMNVEGFPGGGSWLGYYDNQTNYHLQIDQFGVGINSYGALVNLNLRIDTTGIHYITSPDTTLTTPTHLMTEAQTKREIAAAKRWTDTSGGISYGNEVTVGSLAGTGTRNIGADANGKLVEVEQGAGVTLSASTTLTSSQLLNKTWVQLVAPPASGKMIIPVTVYCYYNFGTTAYTTNEFLLDFSYNAGSTPIDMTSSANISTFLSSTSDKVVIVSVPQQIIAAAPSSNALYIRSNTNLTDGDGTLTITLIYTVIDI